MGVRGRRTAGPSALRVGPGGAGAFGQKGGSSSTGPVLAGGADPHGSSAGGRLEPLDLLLELPRDDEDEDDRLLLPPSPLLVLLTLAVA